MSEVMDGMLNVVITGGSGFLGARLARELLAAGTLEPGGGEARPVGRMLLIDRAPAPPDLTADPRVTAVSGDLAEPAGPVREAIADAHVIFHLAAAVSGECEADFHLGMSANLRATQALFAACRAAGTNPVVVFASSLAVFGDSAEHPLPAMIEDQTLPNPQTSYGTQKAVAELLLADYTRKGFLQGRAVRLMTISVRPGRPNAAASGFLSSIIREPLAGKRAVCPVSPGTEVALASPAKAVAALLCAATVPGWAWNGNTAVTMPALTVSVAGMVEALRRVAGPEASTLIDWIPDDEVARMVASWPARVRAERAGRLGMTPDQDFESVIRAHLAESAGLKGPHRRGRPSVIARPGRTAAGSRNPVPAAVTVVA